VETPESFNIYLGTTDPPEFIVNQNGTTYNPPPLAPFRTWHWRVDSVHDGGTTTGSVWSFTTAQSPDFDGDGDVDQEDFGRFQICFSGTSGVQNDPDCQNAKFDGDNDVDQNDFVLFRRCLTGGGIPMDPNCMD
jgi:hypothetical protein